MCQIFCRSIRSRACNWPIRETLHTKSSTIYIVLSNEQVPLLRMNIGQILIWCWQRFICLRYDYGEVSYYLAHWFHCDEAIVPIRQILGPKGEKGVKTTP